MSKFVGIFRKQRGKVGDFVFRKQGNEYIVSEKPPKKGTSIGTRNQALYRAQWGNLVRFWQSFRGLDRPSFESANRNVSHFNLFMRSNINAVEVYLTKEQVRLGACIVAPYRVSEGSLSSIQITSPQIGSFVTSIQLGELVIGSSTTIKAFTEAVLNNNRDFEIGDQLTVFLAFQVLDENVNMPRCVMLSYKVILTTEDDVTLLYQVIPSSVVASEDGALAFVANGDAGVAVVKSRKASDSETLVSSQSFVVNNSILSTYQTFTAQKASAESYGIYDRGDWLTPSDDQTLASN